MNNREKAVEAAKAQREREQHRLLAQIEPDTPALERPPEES